MIGIRTRTLKYAGLFPPDSFFTAAITASVTIVLSLSRTLRTAPLRAPSADWGIYRHNTRTQSEKRAH